MKVRLWIKRYRQETNDMPSRRPEHKGAKIKNKDKVNIHEIIFK